MGAAEAIKTHRNELGSDQKWRALILFHPQLVAVPIMTMPVMMMVSVAVGAVEIGMVITAIVKAVTRAVMIVASTTSAKKPPAIAIRPAKAIRAVTAKI